MINKQHVTVIFHSKFINMKRLSRITSRITNRVIHRMRASRIKEINNAIKATSMNIKELGLKVSMVNAKKEHCGGEEEYKKTSIA